MDDFWSDVHWETVDRLNAVMWRLSPALTWRLHGRRLLGKPGEVGAHPSGWPAFPASIPG